jgi:hypothetical protein
MVTPKSRFQHFKPYRPTGHHERFLSQVYSKKRLPCSIDATCLEHNNFIGPKFYSRKIEDGGAESCNSYIPNRTNGCNKSMLQATCQQRTTFLVFERFHCPTADFVVLNFRHAATRARRRPHAATVVVVSRTIAETA